MSDFVPPAELQAIYKQLLEYADNELPDPVTVRYIGWDDGDYMLKAIHTGGMRRGTGENIISPIVERKQVVYTDGAYIYKEVEEYTHERNGKQYDVQEERRLDG